jgi:hypothetical protein
MKALRSNRTFCSIDDETADFSSSMRLTVVEKPGFPVRSLRANLIEQTGLCRMMHWVYQRALVAGMYLAL